jgi:Leucine-rich repeat (LRR) protein
MASLGGVRLLRDLETLRLVGAPVRSLSGLEDAHLLQELEVESYAGDELFSLKDLPRLHRLSMDHAPDLLSLRGLSGCVALEELVLRDVVSLHDLRTVEHLPQLDRLVLSGLVWHDLIGPQLAKARFLSQLSLMRFERLRHLDWVEALEGLSELSLESLLQLEDLSGIANLPKLNALSIHSCPSVYPAPDKPSMHDREDVKAYQMQIATFSKKRGTLAGQLEKRVARWWPFG